MCSPHIYVPGGVWDTYDVYFVNIHQMPGGTTYTYVDHFVNMH